MRFRKLRIAWSVVCGIVCVLLIVLWVRSYSTLYQIEFWPPVTSAQGRIFLAETFTGTNATLTVTNIHRSSVYRFNGFLELTPERSGIAIPDCYLVLTAAVAAVIPWPRWRFSLRTLLIATTLVPVGLALIVRLNHR